MWLRVLNIVSEASSLATGGSETAPDLESIIDHPLEASEGTDHEDTGAETLPEAAHADSTVDLTDALASLVHDGDTGVGGVGNDGAEDTSQVAGHEGDHHLLALAVLGLRLGEDVGVEHGDDLLEGHELDDGVGDLSSPERLDALVEGVARGVLDLVEAGQGAARPLGSLDSRVGGLHADFELYIWVSTYYFLELNLKKWCQAIFELRFESKILTDSQGQRRMSAMNSAQAEETAQPTFLYLAALAPAALA